MHHKLLLLVYFALTSMLYQYDAVSIQIVDDRSRIQADNNDVVLVDQ